MAVTIEEPSYEELKAAYIQLREDFARKDAMAQSLAMQIADMGNRLADGAAELMSFGWDRGVADWEDYRRAELRGDEVAEPSNPWREEGPDIEAIEAEVSEEQELFGRLADEMKEGM